MKNAGAFHGAALKGPSIVPVSDPRHTGENSLKGSVNQEGVSCEEKICFCL